MKNRKFLRLVAYSGIALLICLNIARAQEPSVSISPASIDAKVKRGASYTQNFTLTNKTGTRLLLHCSLTDFWYDEDNTRLSGRAGTLPRSASLWIQFSPSDVVIEPNSAATVKAIITIPQNVSGSYYAVPNFEAVSADKPAGNANGNQATTSIGIRFRGLMMFTTEEGAEYNVEIMGGKIAPPTDSAEMELNLDLRNRGTAHARMRGSFAILDSKGALAGRGNIAEKRYLPAQRDFIKAGWAGKLPPGNYTCIVTLSYNRVGLEPISLVYELPFAVKQ